MLDLDPEINASQQAHGEISDNVLSAQEVSNQAQFILANRTPESLLEHPLLAQSITLPTAPIRALLGALRRALMMREQGVCFLATSGFGKSYALNMAEKELKRMFPDVPIYLHVVNNRQVPSIRSFFKHFLMTVGVQDLKGETTDLRVRLINRLVDAGRGSRQKIIVFLIDEAQGMDIQDFQFLKDIGNQLERMQLRLIVAMMGQDPDFSQVVASLRKEGRLDLISRFTLRRMQFAGLSSEQDLLELLIMIDEEEYPLGTGIYWPQYFAPKAWSDGFRMKKQLAPLTEALCKRLPGNTLEGGVSARQLFLAIRRFMIDYADIEAAGQKLPDDAWETCCDYALIKDAAEIAAEHSQARQMKIKP